MTGNPIPEILVGTGNQGKFDEIRELLTSLFIKLLSLKDFPRISSVEETGRTYEENSKLKALAYSKDSGLPALADDSGLEVDALGGLPGVYSARFGGESLSQSERITKLVSAIEQSDSQLRTARFVCSLTFVGFASSKNVGTDNAEVLKVTRGELSGEIISVPRGSKGFGYDPVFVPAGYSQTLAELPASVKNTLSHRARAFEDMRTFLEHWIEQT